MDNKKLSHDILNLLERLRIMHEMIKDQKFEVISKEEVKQDLKDALALLESKFESLIQ